MEWKTRQGCTNHISFYHIHSVVILLISTWLIYVMFYHASVNPFYKKIIDGGRFDTDQKPRNEPIIKFYLYPLEYFPSFWGKKSTCDHSKVLFEKHDSYIYAIQAMKRHPWRTSVPNEAMIAFLPISLDVFARGGCPGLKLGTIQQELKGVIQNSTIFPKIRHVFIAQDWKTWGIDRKIFLMLKPAGIVAAMEGRGDCKTSLPYSTNYATFMSMRDPNSWHIPNPAPFGSSRIYSVNMVGTFVARQQFSERVALFKSNGTLPNSFIVTTLDLNRGEILALMKKDQRLRFCNHHNDTDRCISQDKYPSRLETQAIMEKSNYTLALRGDTYGSDRWSQAMVTGNALIQVIDSEKAWDWLPFPCSVPWRDIVLTIPKDKYMSHPASSVKELISSVTDETQRRLQQSSLYYAEDIDWTSYNSRVLENFLRESYYVPCRDFERSIGASSSPELLMQEWCSPRKMG